jgi:PTH1 family peptidyl-tRNA hydrolase
VEALAGRLGIGLSEEECGAKLGAAEGVVLALPQTYMNRSGFAVRCLADRHGVSPQDVLLVYDEVALPLGRLRARASGGAAGHRGMESVIENLRSDQAPRLRLGVGPQEPPPAGTDLADFVLAPFTDGEERVLEHILPVAVEAQQLFLAEGIEAVMNRFNGFDLRGEADLG